MLLATLFAPPINFDVSESTTMKHVVAADPEVSTFLIFEPTVVARDFDLANEQGTHDETLQKLHGESKVILMHTDGDSGGIMHAYIDEDAPESFGPFILNTHRVEPFEVLGDELHYTGVFGYVHPDEFDLPPTGMPFPIAPGHYRICVYEMKLDRDFMKNVFSQRASPRQQFMFNWIDTIMILVGVVLLSCIVSVFFLSWFVWFSVMLFIAVPTFLVPQFWCRSRPYQKALRVWESVAKGTPNLVATFDRIAS